MIKNYCDRCACEFDPKEVAKVNNKNLVENGGIEVASVFTMRENPDKNDEEPRYLYDRRIDFCPGCFAKLNQVVTDFINEEGMFSFTPSEGDTP